MKKLDTKVNIIPIIAKADTISKTELQKFKVYIEMNSNIYIYILQILYCIICFRRKLYLNYKIMVFIFINFLLTTKASQK